MISLKHKLQLGYSGLLILLLIVGGMATLLMERYNQTLERIFKENYQSIAYSHTMHATIDIIEDDRMNKTSAQFPPRDLVSKFQSALIAEKKNITVRGEQELADELEKNWMGYLNLAQNAQSNKETQSLRDFSRRIKDLSQKIIDINLVSIFSLDGDVQASTNEARKVMVALLLAGVALALMLIFYSSRSILYPLGLITRSAEEIARGNLDLTLPVSSKDEIGKLSESFNSMTLKLREFRRTNRTQLQRVQKTTQVALDTFPEAVAVVGPDGKVEIANHLAHQRFGLFAGVDILKHDQKILWTTYQEAFKTLQPVKYKGYQKAIQLFFEGDEYFFLTGAVPMLGDQGELQGVTLVLTDVTNLRRIDETKSSMLSVVSHELKTPLTSIRMATHLLLDERLGQLNEKQLDLILTDRDDAERLHRIIDNLLDLGRMESGENSLIATSVPVDKLIDDAAQMYNVPARDLGITLKTAIEDSLPLVEADLSRIPYVFSNILTNAIKHTAPGGTILMGAALAAEPGFVEFFIENPGITIPPAYYQKIFERFARIPDQSQGIDGVGLGLAIAKDIVNAHGGTIGTSPARGSDGARFTFTLKISTSITRKA